MRGLPKKGRDNKLYIYESESEFYVCRFSEETDVQNIFVVLFIIICFSYNSIKKWPYKTAKTYILLLV